MTGHGRAGRVPLGVVGLVAGARTLGAEQAAALAGGAVWPGTAADPDGDHRTVFRLSTPQISVDVYGTEDVGGTLKLVSRAADFEVELVGERVADDWTAFRVEASVPFADDFQVVYEPGGSEPVVLSGDPYSTDDLLTLAETQGGLPAEVLLPVDFFGARYARVASSEAGSPEASADARPVGRSGLTPDGAGVEDDPLWRRLQEAGHHVYVFRRVGEEGAYGFLELVPTDPEGAPTWTRGRSQDAPFSLFEGGRDEGERVWFRFHASDFESDLPELYFWSSEVALPDEQIARIGEDLVSGGAPYLTPFGVRRTPQRLGPEGVEVQPGTYSVSSREALTAATRARFNVFLTDVRASVRHLVKAYKQALALRGDWADAAAPTALLAGLAHEPLQGGRQYLRGRLRPAGPFSMREAWAATPEPEAVSVPTEPVPEAPEEAPEWERLKARPLAHLPDRLAVSRPELPRGPQRPSASSTLALGQWRYGHARQAQALDAGVEAAVAALVRLLNSSVVRQTELDLASVQDQDGAPPAVDDLIDEHLDAFVRLPESLGGQRYMASVCRASEWSRILENEAVADPFAALRDDDGGYDRLKLLFKLARKWTGAGFKVLGATVTALPYVALGDRAAGVVARLTTAALGLSETQEWALHRGPVMVRLRNGSTIGPARAGTRVVALTDGADGLAPRALSRYTLVELQDTNAAVARTLALKTRVTAILEVANIGIAAAKVESAPGGPKAADWLGLAKAVGSGLALVNDVYGDRAWAGTADAGAAKAATRQFLRVGGVVLEVVLGVRATGRSVRAGEGLGALGNALWTVGSVTASLSSGSGALVVLGGVAVTATMLLGAAFLAAGGLFLLAQHQAGVREERESDPLWDWFYAECVWGQGYVGSGDPRTFRLTPRPLLGAPEAMYATQSVEIVDRGYSDVAPLFELVRPGWSAGSGPSGSLDGRVKKQAAAFAHTAYRVRVDLRPDVRERPVFEDERGPRVPNYEVRGLWLTVTPEWAPGAGVIRVGFVARSQVSDTLAPLRPATADLAVEYVRDGGGLRYRLADGAGTPLGEWVEGAGGVAQVWFHGGGLPVGRAAPAGARVEVPNLAAVLGTSRRLVVRGATVAFERPGGGQAGTRVVGPWFTAAATAVFDALQTLDPAGAAAARRAGYAPPDEAEEAGAYSFPRDRHRLDGF